jgi:predicted SAM-dependent methyltransferase
MKKLHLGCWHRDFPGFINVDLCDMPHIHFKSNINELPFIGNSEIDLIYCSHAFEYFDQIEARKALTEWKRVLNKNGILRLAVPNFEALVEVYKVTSDLNKILGPLYGRMEINNGNKILFHKTCYDFNSLKFLLEENGFKNIKLYDWRETEHSQFDDHSQAYFPHLDKENGLLVSLNIECQKI